VNDRQTNRRTLLKAGIGASAVALAGVSSVASSKTSAFAIPAVQTTTTLQMLTSAGGAEPGLRAMAQKFMDEKNGTVNIEISSTPLPELYTRAIAEFTAQSDSYDLLTLNDQWAGSWAPYLVPLEEVPGYSPADAEGIIPAVQAMASWDGVSYGLAHRVGANILFYRADLLEETGLEVPLTQEDYLNAAIAMTGDGVYGLTIAAGGSPYSTLDYLNLLWARGGREINEDFTQPLLDQEIAIETCAFYTGLYTDHDILPPDVLSYTFEQNVTAMQQGIAAMMIEYSARVGPIEDPESSLIAGEVGYALVPLGEGVVRAVGNDYMAGHSIVLNGFADPGKRELAYEFAKYCTTTEAQLEMALEYANGPTVSAVFESPEYQEEVPAAPVIMEALSTARTRPAIPQWNDMDLALGEALDRVFVGRATPEEAMAECNARWSEILQR
jgi:multiple sugar transport system substrate-binding protein